MWRCPPAGVVKRRVSRRAGVGRGARVIGRRRADELIERSFAAGARLRGGRLFHPEAAVFEARARVTEPAHPLAATLVPDGAAPALVRLSRAFGLPRRLGDVHGLAVRLLEPDGRRRCDLLLATCAGGAVGKWVPAPSRNSRRLRVSTLLPFRCGRVTVCVGADVDAPGGVDDVIAGAARRLSIRLWAAARLQPPRELATVDLLRALDAAAAAHVAFDPFATPPGFAPAGFVNRLRPPAYRGSQRGRGVTATA
jgi:hypothetical protein